MKLPRAGSTCVVGVLLLCAAGPGAGQSQERTPAMEAASRLLRAHMERLEVPGMSVAVALGGEMLWSEGFGYEDLETREPVTPGTRFRIGSVSKPLTATAAARLYEAGMLDLDRPIREYLPSFPAKEHPVTARQLASHLAGIRHYRDKEESRSNRHFPSVAASLELFAEDPLLFEPGTQYHYSSYGMGWEIREDPEGRTVYYHGGMVTGGLAHLVLYPESGLVVAVLANTSEGIGFNEDEAFALASLFVPGTSLAVEPSLDPTGAYVFETVWDETRWGGDREERVGLLQIFPTGDHWEGLLTFEDWRPAKIPVVRFEGAEAQLIAVPGNWIFLDLRLEEEGLSGTWVIPGPEIGGTLEGMERVFPRPSESRGKSDR